MTPEWRSAHDHSFALPSTDVGFGDLGPIAGGIKNMLARGQAFALSAVTPVVQELSD